MPSFIRPTLALATFALAWTAAGCGGSYPPPASPVVDVDSEAGRKARAEDEADRAQRKRMEMKALSRKKSLSLPDEG